MAPKLLVIKFSQGFNLFQFFFTHIVIDMIEIKNVFNLLNDYILIYSISINMWPGVKVN